MSMFSGGGQKKKGRATPGPRPKRNRASLDNLVEEMIAEGEEDALKDLSVAPGMTEEEQAPVVLLVFALLKEAVKRDVSDIHIEPEETGLRIRFRVDGVLQEFQRLPKKLTMIIVSRLKIMAELDITERRIPQDGVIRLRSKTENGEDDSTDADFRMSTLPSLFGEKVVLRVLKQDGVGQTLEQVGLPKREFQILKTAISKPDGLILVTGPTGSGKTTTLYAALQELNEPVKSIFTAEDPVEGTIPGITQVQTNNSVGYNFSTVLRSLLRQDPDIILVGEIRDKETIDIALKAAMTGHLVLSTLHTNDTAATVQRMLNMGVEPYLISSAVNLIVAQRLVRRICDGCKTRVNIDGKTLERFGLHGDEIKARGVYRGTGCDDCAGTGYKGRAPLYEMMVIDERLKDGVLKGASASALKRYARKAGMRTLRDSGISLIKQGITTLEEVLAKTNDDEPLGAGPDDKSSRPPARRPSPDMKKQRPPRPSGKSPTP